MPWYREGFEISVVSSEYQGEKAYTNKNTNDTEGSNPSRLELVKINGFLTFLREDIKHNND